MFMEALEENVIARIRSSSAIESVTQCVNELVLNSLDAKSTSIAVRINLTAFRIRVIDNGRGISRSNLDFVGQRYMTNKCHSLQDLKRHLKYYGFKGEALANISAISQKVIITSREHDCDETFDKIIENNESKIELGKCRASFGTTVTVEGFLNNLPVRQRCVKNNELDSVKKSLESLIIIHPRVSFTLRNDVGAKLILASVKCPDIAGSFRTIHPEIDENDFAPFKVSKNKTSVEGLIYKQLHENKRLQYIYVNKRPINCQKIQNFVNALFQKSNKNFKADKKKNPIFIIHIKCPYSDVDITLEPTKTLAFFKKIDIVKRCIEKMIDTFLGKENVTSLATKTKKVGSEFGVSQIEGVVKGFGVKRKNDDVEDITSNKSAKIIEDTPFFEETKVPSKQMKMALPIEIKKNDRKENENVMNVADNSFFTNFPENEKKGKNVIMNMFIMSLKVFPPEENENVDGENSVPDVSDAFEENSSSLQKLNNNKVTTGIQTTLENVLLPKTSLVSVGVQAGPGIIYSIPECDVTFVPRKPLTKFVSDYDFDFSKIDTFPNFNFNKKYQEDLSFFKLEQTKKLFDFRNNFQPDFTFFGNREQSLLEPNFLKVEYGFDQINNVQTREEKSCKNHKQSCFYENLEDNFVRPLSPEREPIKSPLRKNIFSQRLKENIVQQSPYFSKKQRLKNLVSEKYDKVSKLCEFTHVVDDFKKSQKSNLNKIEVSFSKKNKMKRLNESNVSKYFNKKKIIDSLIINKRKSSFENSEDLFCFAESIYENRNFDKIDKSDLVTSICEGKNDSTGENKMTEDIIGPTLTVASDEWIKEVNDFGTTVYINKRTGLKTLKSPKKDTTFEMTERFDFVPKGLSPVLKNYSQVDNMSPKSKERLQDAIIQSYDDELLFIKWRNFLKNRDPKFFFAEIYLEKSKVVEGSIPNINRSKYATRAFKGFENMNFTKSLFCSLDIIGQIDCKFIAVLERKKKLILLFDQHAVHERVRVEELSESYKNTSVKLDQNITIFLPQMDLRLLKRQKTSLPTLGVIIKFFGNGITVIEVPLCIYNKSKKGADIVFLTENLIKEIVDTLKMNDGILVNTPKIIQNIVNSEACRGAIKFGDLLSRNECLSHLKNLARCSLPFQCAHGRPTLTPLLLLNSFQETNTPKPNLRNLTEKS